MDFFRRRSPVIVWTDFMVVFDVLHFQIKIIGFKMLKPIFQHDYCWSISCHFWLYKSNNFSWLNRMNYTANESWYLELWFAYVNIIDIVYDVNLSEPEQKTFFKVLSYFIRFFYCFFVYRNEYLCCSLLNKHV